jgi:hypothetical protein
MTHKESESDETEQDILNKNEETIINKHSLQDKLKSRKSKIESLIQENEKITKELENSKQKNNDLVNKKSSEDRQNISVKFKNESQEFKITKGGKRAYRKNVSGIQRQKTGYNVKTKQIMNKNRKLDDDIEQMRNEVESMTAQKSSNGVSHSESDNSEIIRKNIPDFTEGNSIPASSTPKNLTKVVASEAEIAD